MMDISTLAMVKIAGNKVTFFIIAVYVGVTGLVGVWGVWVCMRGFVLFC